jgi:hypothetical protein
VREGHPVVGAAALALFALLASKVLGTEPAADDLQVYDVVPPNATVHLRVGERRQFSVWVEGEGLRYLWMLDGTPVGDRHSWMFDATAALAGAHQVAVAIGGPGGRGGHDWTVEVEMPAGGAMPPPSSSLPSTPSTSTTASSSTSIATSTTSRPSTTASPTSTTTTSTRPPTSTTTRTTTTRTTTTRTTTTRTTTTRTATTATETTTTRPAVTTATRPSGAITDADVHALLARYTAAWHSHDAETLRAIGQVSTEGQMEALKSYFESVQDLDVEVTILDIRLEGDGARVRFIRRDKFKDPGGNYVSKESPTIEKRVIRTPGGPSFAPLQ